ncbi:leucyl/phenylalanyl-tRNA--protein transferase [Xanthomonadaceae bacterium JHOS43]|nr:leucyl/phenylalanyl-tRNA--protein transferase [Xanthomonadaceae bacterium JHOS43]MCX7563892.1 leucyl/phenylalanyl-tRNA--protein transferase [Xanthomonadaceae bacterium XH05]
MIRLPRLDDDPGAPFPPADTALREPDGLLAFGGDLSPQRLINAYRHGIFPWFSMGDPILWWSPDPRTVFDTGALHLPRRFRRQLRQCQWTIRVDDDFDVVVAACASVPRTGQGGTWILPEMQAAYGALHRLGHAHSVAVYDGDRLVGGIYGVDAGPAFCGESMFSAESGGSKVALAALCRLLHAHGVPWLDAQMHTPHLATLGARSMSRGDYLRALSRPRPAQLPTGPWTHLLTDTRAHDFT